MSRPISRYSVAMVFCFSKAGWRAVVEQSNHGFRLKSADSIMSRSIAFRAERGNRLTQKRLISHRSSGEAASPNAQNVLSISPIPFTRRRRFATIAALSSKVALIRFFMLNDYQELDANSRSVFNLSCPHAASMSCPFSRRSVALTFCFSKVARKASQTSSVGRSHGKLSTLL